MVRSRRIRPHYRRDLRRPITHGLQIADCRFEIFVLKSEIDSMPELNTFSKDWIARITRVVRAVERWTGVGPNNEDSDHHQANAMYVAKLPAAGIPARKGKRLGRAMCEIWRSEPLVFGSTIRDLVPNILPNGQRQKEWVYNLSSIKITVPFFKVDQDAFDSAWYVDCPCGTVVGSSSSSSSESSSSESSSSSDPSSSEPSSSSDPSSISESSSYYDSSSSDDYDDPPNGPCICTYSECCYEDGWGNNLLHNTNPPCGEGYTSVTTWRCYSGGGGDWCTISGLCTYNMAPGGFEGETRGTPYPCCG